MGGLFDLEANSCYSSCWSLKYALVTITTVAAYAHNHDRGDSAWEDYLTSRL